MRAERLNRHRPECRNKGGDRALGTAGAMLAVSLISYIDRNTLAILAPTILRETGLSGEQ
jgi:hypothetical protein